MAGGVPAYRKAGEAVHSVAVQAMVDDAGAAAFALCGLWAMHGWEAALR
jgi:hypothetical protein